MNNMIDTLNIFEEVSVDGDISVYYYFIIESKQTENKNFEISEDFPEKVLVH